jgi:hypothetical protein
VDFTLPPRRDNFGYGCEFVAFSYVSGDYADADDHSDEHALAGRHGHQHSDDRSNQYSHRDAYEHSGRYPDAEDIDGALPGDGLGRPGEQHRRGVSETRRESESYSAGMRRLRRSWPFSARQPGAA